MADLAHAAQLLTPDERRQLTSARFGRRMGLGRRPAVLVVDVQNYMVGPPAGSHHAYPSACGEAAQNAVRQLTHLLAGLRQLKLPVVYTRMEFARNGSDMGAYGLKRDLLTTEGWCLADSEGAQIVEALAPQPGDVVLVKKRPSAFFETSLRKLLRSNSVDTIVVTGGSTSNCVRATAVDACSNDFRTVVVADCVFDRVEISHRVALFDLDRQYADVMDSHALLGHLRAGG